MRQSQAKRFFKTLIAGIVGAGCFFTVMTFLLSLVKIYYILINKDFLLSKTVLGITTLAFIIIGFIIGVRIYVNKRHTHKVYAPTSINLLLNFIIVAIFTFGVFIVLKNLYNIVLIPRMFVLLFVIMYASMYPFSANLSFKMSSTRAKPSYLTVILFNPIFIMLYLWFFVTIVYNSAYIPCGVSIIGVDKNPYTANTLNLGIKNGERIVSLDDTPVNSLNDIEKYIDSLDTTKEIVLETENKLYYVNTYQVGNDRFLGLVLRQDYCKR